MPDIEEDDFDYRKVMNQLAEDNYEEMVRVADEAYQRKWTDIKALKEEVQKLRQQIQQIREAAECDDHVYSETIFEIINFSESNDV